MLPPPQKSAGLTFLGGQGAEGGEEEEEDEAEGRGGSGHVGPGPGVPKRGGPAGTAGILGCGAARPLLFIHAPLTSPATPALKGAAAAPSTHQ